MMKTTLVFVLALTAVAQQPETPQPASPVQGGVQQPLKTQAPAVFSDENFSGSVDVGVRAISGVGGDFNTYRSVVNLGEGLRLLDVGLTLQDPGRRYFDRIDARGSNWGGDPYNTARIDARRERTYQLSFDYRNISYFNFLPSFANPLSDLGIFESQRTFDTFRRTSNVELELRPGTRIVPFAAYTRNSGNGTGLLNFVLPANEYPVFSNFNDHTDNIRGGVRFQLTRFHFTVEQGGLNYASGETAAPTGPGNLGNVTTPFRGQQLVLNSGAQSWLVEGSGIFTRGLLTANPVDWVNLYGQFLYSQPSRDATFTQNNTGNFFDFNLLRFYQSQVDALSSSAKRPHTSGSFGAEIRPIRQVRLLESWITDRLHTSGSALLTNRLISNGATLPLQTGVFSERLELNRNQQEFQVLFDVTRNFTLRGGHRYEWGDARVPPSFLIEAPFEEAKLQRHVALAGANARFGQRFNFNFHFEGSPGDRSFFRTSLHDYRLARIRARYQVLSSLLLSANFNVLSNHRPNPELSFDFLSRQNSVSLSWLPGGGRRATVITEYTRFTQRSEIAYFIPTTLQPDISFYRENGHSGVALLEVGLPGNGIIQPRVTVGGSLVSTSGSRPSRYYQPLGRLLLPLTNRVQWYGEWHWYALSQPFYVFEGFRNHQFVTGFRLGI